MESADYWRGHNDRKWDERRNGLAVVGMLVVSAILFWIVPSYFEARTYSRLTGAKVTMWDAMWVDLRVQESIPGE